MMVGRNRAGDAARDMAGAPLTMRGWRRAQARLATRGQRRRRWRSRGQTLIFFALSVTMLVAILGLAVDTIRIYDLYARMQRAAEAGALAAVLYMPNYYTADLTTPPADNAICRALEETIKDGFGQPCGSSLASYCPGNPATVEVAICPVAGKPHDLAVYITESSNVIFLSAVNVGPVTVTVKAQAEYLPPVQIGLDTGRHGAGYFGGYGGCTGGSATDPSGCAFAPQAFLANINGPAELKEQGDPYVNCEEGPAHVAAVDQSAANLPTYTGYSGSQPIPGLLTNHQQYTTDYSTILANHCGAHNTDQQPVGFAGPATSNTSHPGGYTYLVDVMQAGAGLWIYNASYIPSNQIYSPAQPTACTGPQQIDQFAWYPNTISGFCFQDVYQQYGGQSFNVNEGFTDPRYYYNTTYTLYSVPGVTTLTAGTQVAKLVAPPYDGTQLDLTIKNCSSAQVYNPQTSACVAAPASQFGWTQLASNLPVGQYRLEVEATGLTSSTLGWGQHGYGLRVCPSGATQGSQVSTCINNPANPPGDISALGAADMTLIFQTNQAVTAFPLAVIPTEYAGRTVQVSLFDAGDPINAGLGNTPNTAFYIMPPQSNGQANSCSVNASALTGYTFNYPSWATYTSLSTAFGVPNPNKALITSQANAANSFNGIWAPITVTLPPSYTQGQWTLCGYENVTNAQDTLAIAIAPLGQSPAHLV